MKKMKNLQLEASSTKYDHFMRVCTNKNEENEKPSTKEPSTKYDHFMRVSTNKNEENEKYQLRDHPQNTSTL